MTTNVVREPGQWRDAHGNQPDETLHLHQVGPTLDGTEPNWRTITGWRRYDDQADPQWVLVQVRTE